MAIINSIALAFPPDKIRFVPESHSYFLGERQLTSVTTIIKPLVPQFDRERISAKTAAKRGVSQESLLAEWDRKAAVALEKGTRVHSYIDDVLGGPADDVLLSVNAKLPEMCAFDEGWEAMRRGFDAKVLAKEKVIWSESLGVAGRVDLILQVFTKDGKFVSVFDWKTGRFAITNVYERLRPPFDDLDNCELAVYSLQTSLYRLILEAGGVAVGPAYLAHLSEFGTYHLYRAIDLRERVGEWLKTRPS